MLELARVLLRGEHATLEVLPPDMMIGEALAAIEAKAPAAVVVPSLPPAGLTPARHLCMRLHARIPSLVARRRSARRSGQRGHGAGRATRDGGL